MEFARFGKVVPALCAAVALALLLPATASASEPARDPGWQRPLHLGSFFSDVSCASPRFCAAVTWYGGVRMFDGRSWSPEQPIVDSGANVHVSCPSASFCAASVGSTGEVVTYRDGAWGPPQVVDPDVTLLLAVSCGSPTLCVAVDLAGPSYVFDGTSWTAGRDFGDPVAVSCTSTAFCMVMTYGGRAWTYDGSTWSDAGFARDGIETVVSCASRTFCASSGRLHKATVYSHGVWGSTVRLQRYPKGGVTGLSCPAATLCFAVDGDGKAYRYDGTGWTKELMRHKGWHGDAEVSCASVRFCVAVDSYGTLSYYRG